MANDARALITRALRTLGVLATGEAAPADVANDALESLNEMLDTWSLESLAVYDETLTTHVLTASKASYTIGSGGDIAISWPIQIDMAQLRVTTATPNIDLPLRVLSDQEYAVIPLKTEESTYPTSVWLDRNYPLAVLHLWPVPNQVNTLVLWTKGIVQTFAALSTLVSVPRGYERALRFNLAVELAPEYGKAVSAELRELARESKAWVKRANSKPLLLTSLACPMGGRRRYNVQSDAAATAGGSGFGPGFGPGFG